MAKTDITLSDDELQQERWLPVPGLEEYYSVSDLGRVRRDKAGPSTRVGRILRPVDAGNGYLRVYLGTSPQDRTLIMVHALVLAAFSIGPRNPEKDEINHKDFNSANNRLSNLEYVSHLENQQHARRGGRYRIHEAHHGAKINMPIAREIRYLKSNGWSMGSLARHFSVSRSTIYDVVHCHIWQE